MNKVLSSLILTAILFLSGCGFLEETQNTINYATETTEYLNELSTVAEEIQTSINEGNATELEGTLTEIEATIQEFNSIEVPTLAEGIHDDILAQNEKLLEIIDQVQANGEVALEELKNTELVQTMESISNFMDQIEQLGFE